MAETGPKNQKTTFITPGCQSMQLRKTNHNIKKFHHVLQGHLDQQRDPGLGQWLTVAGRRLDTHLQNVSLLKKIQVAQEGILNLFIVFGGYTCLHACTPTVCSHAPHSDVPKAVHSLVT